MANFNPMNFIQGMLQKNPNIGNNVGNRTEILSALMSGDTSRMEQLGRQELDRMGITEQQARKETSNIMQNQFGFKI